MKLHLCILAPNTELHSEVTPNFYVYSNCVKKNPHVVFISKNSRYDLIILAEIHQKGILLIIKLK